MATKKRLRVKAFIKPRVQVRLKKDLKGIWYVAAVASGELYVH